MAAGGYWRLLSSNRDFRLLYLATLISLGGDWFLTVALLDLVLELSGSATLASLVVVLQSLPIFLVTPFAGHAIDRMDRRKLMILVDVMRAAAALLPLLATSAATLPFAYLGVTLIAVGAGVFDPAASAALPNMVGEKDLGRANVLIGSTWGTMLAVGAAMGGLVTLQFGRRTSFVVDAVSFLVSALLIISIRSPFSLPRADDHEHPRFGESIRQTFRYAKGAPRVLALLTSKGGYGIGAGVVAMLGVFGREVFGAGAFGIGLLFAARGAGALVGPFVARALSRTDDQQYRLIPAGVALFGAGYVALAYAPSLWIGILAAAVAHMGGGAQWQTSTYGLQREVPDHIRGRVFAADYGLVTLTMSLSSVTAGVLADRIGAVHATAAVALMCVLWAAIWWWWTRRLWRA